ncbi:MAG: hypothetical protein HUN04_08485 [Desulfobacter sp.]|nr:MAG: hypothetical protein HUN04_08485 [Desulfobacter sp.]
MCKILGLSINGAQTSACLLKDGCVESAASEERFSRIKRDSSFPRHSIAYCLETGKLSSLNDCDAIAVSWNPGMNMRHINMSGFTRWRRYDPEWLYIVPNNLMDFHSPSSEPKDALRLHLGMAEDQPIYFVNHHLSHAAHCVLHAPFERGAFAVVDEYGEIDSVTCGVFGSNGIQIQKKIPYPHSLGIFYAAITEFLGFMPNCDEWKVMGAAAYGDPNVFSDKLAELIVWDEADGEWYINQRYIDFANMKKGGYGVKKLEKAIGIPARSRCEKMMPHHFDLASGAQYIFEKMLFTLLQRLNEKTGMTELAVSGGCFMNSLANGKITGNTPFNQVFIPYAAADNGGAVGAALWVHSQLKKGSRIKDSRPPSPFLGPRFSTKAVRSTLENYGIPYSVCDNPSAAAAQEIYQGKLVGWFSGGMEFGERALGARSILADPRLPDIKDRINSCVKYREPFRPFAASVIDQSAHRYFDCGLNQSIPYMERVVSVRPDFRERLPGITHKDGSCRIQTVSRNIHSAYYDLLVEFSKLSQIDIVLNTSFNVQGEPIVCSPKDAIRTFFSSGLDVLFLEKCIIRKKNLA